MKTQKILTVSLLTFILVSFIFVLGCEPSSKNTRNQSALTWQKYKTQESWNQTFHESLHQAVEQYKNGRPIDKQQLYDIGRAYIRKKLEEQFKKIEKSELNTASEEIVLKAVYDFFNYTNPLGLTLDTKAPGFDPNLPYNKALFLRWKDLSNQALQDATTMYNYGDKIYGDQVYELGRAIFLTKMHSKAPTSDDPDITPEQWKVLRSVFYLISYLNSPGGPDMTYAPDFKTKTDHLKTKDQKWTDVEKTLQDNKGVIGIGNGLIAFLVGSPSSWQSLSKKIPDTEYGKDTALILAIKINNTIIKAASHYTDIQNAEANKNDQTSLFQNYVSGDDYAPFLPPSIRINLLNHINTDAEPSSKSLADHMTGFENNGRIYGLSGWQGIAKQFLTEWNAKQNKKPTLNDFETYLQDQNILLQKAKLGDKKNTSLETYLESSSGEKTLGDFFSEISVFSYF